MEQKMVPMTKNIRLNRVPTNLNETINTGTCIVRVEWKDETCKDARCSQWIRQSIGINPSLCRGVFQSQPENNWIQYRKCKLSGEEAISPAGGLLLHTNIKIVLTYVYVTTHIFDIGKNICSIISKPNYKNTYRP